VRARAAATRWGVPFARREPFERLWPRFEALLVFGRDGVTLWDREGRLRWSPGIAALRLQRIEAGALDDTFLRVTELRSGESILDCTLGLGQDALVAAHAVGPKGRVVGLEKSLPLYAVVSEGIRGHPLGRRIEPVHADAAQWLATQARGAFDVVFFDPMFTRTRGSSGDFATLRRFADHSPLTGTMLEHARRVARRAVVVKGARYSQDLSKLGLRPQLSRRFASVDWALVTTSPR
jgi:16S rRNA (guanine1516-N2)-methyltransferase